jgi:hypothetical protein
VELLTSGPFAAFQIAPVKTSSAFHLLLVAVSHGDIGSETSNPLNCNKTPKLLSLKASLPVGSLQESNCSNLSSKSDEAKCFVF